MKPNEVLEGLLSLEDMDGLAVMTAYASMTGHVTLILEYEDEHAIDYDVRGLDRAESQAHLESFTLSTAVGNISQHHEWPDGIQEILARSSQHAYLHGVARPYDEEQEDN